jgi:NAD(P)-dependent dehydrogenase (short-subunit alcohol dehydrogenase family)
MKPRKLRILLVGAKGVIGKHVHAAIKEEHTVICAGLEPPSTSNEVQLDLGASETLEHALKALGPLDAIISTAGRARFGSLADAKVANLEGSIYGLGLQDKLLGQVNLVLASRDVLIPGGSITLTSGTTSIEPVIGGSGLSMVNGALESWARAAATELPNGLRLNVVSPSLVEGTPDVACAAFPGFELISGERVARAYIRSLCSCITGQVLTV